MTRKDLRVKKSLFGRLRKFLAEQLQIILHDRLSLIGTCIFLGFVLMAIFAPWIAPYDPMVIQTKPDSRVAYLEPPSFRHWLGTTNMGRDVLSQIIIGSRIALLVGILAAFLVTFIGTNIALISGYYKGKTDEFLMRFVDIVYALPLEPFVIVLVMILGPSVWNIILGISLFLWRSPARVIRSQVLSLSERPFVKAAKMAGAGDFRIIYLHIAPNVLPICFLYVAFTMGWAIMAESAVSFLGFGDPKFQSWGGILHMAFLSGAFRNAWWWAVAPGLCIMLLILSVFLISHGYEEVVNPRLRRY
jgi:peptide/nickel transport system permease protein